VVTDTSEAIHHEACKLLYILAWLKEDATRHQATTNPQSMAQTPEQHRGALFARPQMELTLISLRASGTRLTRKHWAAPFTYSQPAACRSRARSGIQARAAQALGDCSSAWLGTYLRSRPSRVSRSLPAFEALLFPFPQLVVIKCIFPFLQHYPPARCVLARIVTTDAHPPDAHRHMPHRRLLLEHSSNLSRPDPTYLLHTTCLASSLPQPLPSSRLHRTRRFLATFRPRHNPRPRALRARRAVA
jgi:hypothetical protein